MHAGIVDTSGASVGTSASAWSGPCEAEGSEASTEASCADVVPDPVESSEAAVAGIPRCQRLSDFLWSQSARQALGSQTIVEMQHELQAALKWEDVSLRCQHIGACKIQDAESDNTTTFAHNHELREKPIRELVLPPASQARPGAAKCWESVPPLTIWTLWSPAENDALRRRDFLSEAAAHAALEADGYGAVVKQEVFAKSPAPDATRGCRWIPASA